MRARESGSQSDHRLKCVSKAVVGKCVRACTGLAEREETVELNCGRPNRKTAGVPKPNLGEDAVQCVERRTRDYIPITSRDYIPIATLSPPE